MKSSLSIVSIAALLVAVSMSGGAAAQRAPESKASLPAGATLEESGTIELPPGAADALWLDFYTGAKVSPQITSRLRAELAPRGYRFTQREEDAKATVDLTGLVRAYNDKRSYDTGVIFLGEVLEQNIDVSQQSATVGRARGLLDSDAGVAQQAERAISAGGGSGGIASGIGAAIVLDWVADATGLRTAVNNGFRKLFGAKGGRPLFCNADCKRTTHEIVFHISVWQGRESKVASYSLIVRQVTDDSDEGVILSLAQYGLSHLLDKLHQASLASAPQAPKS